MALKSSDRAVSRPRGRIQPEPPRTHSADSPNVGTTATGGRRGRVLHLGPPEPPPVPSAKPANGSAPPTLSARDARLRDSMRPRGKSGGKTRALGPATTPARGRTEPDAPDSARQPARPFDLAAFVAAFRETETRRARLRHEIDERGRQATDAEAALARKAWPIIGRWRRRSRASREDQMARLAEEIGALRRQLRDAVVAADFDLDPVAATLFGGLARRFEALRADGAAGREPTDVERARAAGRGDTQIASGHPVQRALEALSTRTSPLHLRHANGKDLLLFPRFVMVLDRRNDAVVDDIRQLFVSAGPSPGATRAPEGTLVATLPGGFDQAFAMGSDAACEAFVQAFADYLDALPPLSPTPVPTPAPDIAAGSRPPSRPALAAAPQAAPADATPPSPVTAAAVDRPHSAGGIAPALAPVTADAAPADTLGPPELREAPAAVSDTPAPAPLPARAAPADDEGSSHWAEPIARLHVPAWRPTVGDDTRTPVDPPPDGLVPATGRPSTPAAKTTAAAETTADGHLFDSRADPRQAPQRNPGAVRPSAASLARRARKRRWLGLGALVLAALAAAAMLPAGLWRPATESANAMTASVAPPLPAPEPVPATPPAPAPSPPPAEAGQPLTAAQVAQLQGRLKALGFNPGPADGVVGPRTVIAARAFQAAYKLAVTGTIDSRLLDDVSAAQARAMGTARGR